MDSYFKEIDRLRNKFDKDLPLGIKEAAWILWADLYVCTGMCQDFMNYAKSIKRNGRKNWASWKSLFNKWKLSLEMDKYRYNL